MITIVRFQQYHTRFLMLPVCKMIFILIFLIGQIKIFLLLDSALVYIYGRPTQAKWQNCVILGWQII